MTYERTFTILVKDSVPTYNEQLIKFFIGDNGGSVLLFKVVYEGKKFNNYTGMKLKALYRDRAYNSVTIQDTDINIKDNGDIKLYIQDSILSKAGKYDCILKLEDDLTGDVTSICEVTFRVVE